MVKWRPFLPPPGTTTAMARGTTTAMARGTTTAMARGTTTAMALGTTTGRGLPQGLQQILCQISRYGVQLIPGMVKDLRL